MLLTTAPLMVKIFTDVTMLIVAIWLWSRPEKPKQNENIQIEKNE